MVVVEDFSICNVCYVKRLSFINNNNWNTREKLFPLIMHRVRSSEIKHWKDLSKVGFGKNGNSGNGSPRIYFRICDPHSSQRISPSWLASACPWISV